MPTLAERYAQQYGGSTSAAPSPGGTFRAGSRINLAAKTPTATTINKPRPSVIGAFTEKASAVGKQTFDIGRALTGKAAGFVKNTAVDIGKEAYGATLALNPQITQQKIRATEIQRQALEAKQKKVMDAYKQGKMSKDNYIQTMKGFADAYGGLSNETTKLIREADPQARASDLGWTAINVLSGFTAGLVKSGVKQGVKTGFTGAVEKGVANAEKAIMRVPAARELMVRNANKVVAREAQQIAGETAEQWLARSGKQIAIGLLIKRPIFYQTNIGLANEAYQHILDGEYQEAVTPAAWLGVQMIGGGPIGYFMRQAKSGKAHLGELARGRGSFIDELSRRTDTNLAEFIQKNAKKGELGDVERTWRIAQTTNMTASGNKVDQAVDNFLQPYIQAGVDLKTVTEKELTEGMAKWAKADELRRSRLGAGLIKGVDPADVDKYAVVRWDTVMKDGLTRELAAVAKEDGITHGARQDMIKKLIEISDRPGVGWGNNGLLMTRLTNEVAQATSMTDLAKAIKQINTSSVALKGMPKKISDEFAKLGYTLAAPFGGNKIARVDYDNIAESTQRIITGAVKGDTALFDAARAPEPILSSIAEGLQKVGLSPESATEISHRKLSEALIANLGELDVAKSVGLIGKEGDDFVNGGRAILSELQRYVEAKKGAFGISKISSGKSAVTDIRQLTNGEIASALKISQSQAKEVARSIRDAYTKVPLEFRGLGDKIVDYAIKAPLSPMRYYQRIQSALRYTYNPFFRFQEQAETTLLASMNADRFIWAHRGLDDTAKLLEREGFFSGNVFGAGADDAVIGRISANLTKYQKRNLAGLAETIAKGQGKTVSQLIQDNPEQIDDALRVIVQYPKKGALSSPLARTINLAFFPMRYNLKVSTLAAEKLATLPPSVQYGFLQGVFRMKEWLNSDEGIRWRKEHADAIQVWSWASPLGNIAQIYKLFNRGLEAPGDLGLLGGLPFGVISQVLDGQGIIDLNKPYVDPKTGDVLPDYIPLTARAKAAVALQDLLGTMFSFPGRTLGLPGKEANLRKAVDLFIDTNGKDFLKEVNEDELTPSQKNLVRVLKGDTSPEALDALYYAPAPGQFDYYTIPPMDLPVVKPLVEPVSFQRRTGLPKKPVKTTARGKKQKPLPRPIPTR